MKKIMFNDKYGLTQAVLEGRKTQTRRIIKMPEHDIKYLDEAFDWDLRESVIIDWYSKYKEGDLVAVAQAYNDFYNDGYNPNLFPPGAGWLNKMFVVAELMPHQIRIINVRIERMQDISDDDCLAEGIRKGVCGSADTHFMEAYYLPIPYEPYTTPKEAYSELIDKICGKGTWDRNPYVFVYDFELLR